MGIFYIGGIVQVSLPWRLEDIDKLTAVAEDDSEEPWAPPFDIFEGTNCPGQHWACYRSQKENELPSDKNLWHRMVDLIFDPVDD